MTTSDALTALEKITGRRLTLGSAMWALRTTEEMSQVAFAEKLGVSKQYLCDLEHDRKSVSPKQAAKFARLLGHPEITFVQLCLQDQLDHDHLTFEVTLEKVA